MVCECSTTSFEYVDVSVVEWYIVDALSRLVLPQVPRWTAEQLRAGQSSGFLLACEVMSL
jgi:hypothetical protein